MTNENLPFGQRLRISSWNECFSKNAAFIPGSIFLVNNYATFKYYYESYAIRFAYFYLNIILHKKEQ